MGQSDPATPPPTAWLRLKNLAPLGILLLVVALVFGLGLHRELSFDAIALRYAAMTGWVTGNPVLAFFGTLAVYAAATAISFPAGWLLTVTAGLVLGWVLGAMAVVLGATLGATLLFLATRLALADFFRARAGTALNRMAKGFREDAVSYMLFLRLAPVFPFTLVNVVPAILGVPLKIYLPTTLLGIIPGTVAYAFAGEGLRSIVADRAAACTADLPPCGAPLSPGDLITPQILIAFGLLGAVSLLPVLIKRLRGRNE